MLGTGLAGDDAGELLTGLVGRRWAFYPDRPIPC